MHFLVLVAFAFSAVPPVPAETNRHYGESSSISGLGKFGGPVAFNRPASSFGSPGVSPGQVSPGVSTGAPYGCPPGAPPVGQYGGPPGGAYGGPPGGTYGGPPGGMHRGPPGGMHGGPPGGMHGGPPGGAYGGPPGGMYGGPPGGMYGGPPGTIHGSPPGPAPMAMPGIQHVGSFGGPHSFLELFPACKMLGEAMTEKRTELMQSGKFDPWSCQEQDYKLCELKDMETVRCAVTEALTEGCIDQIKALVEGEKACPEGEDEKSEIDEKSEADEESEPGEAVK